MKINLLAILLLFLAIDLNAKIIYVQPVQNAKYVSTENNIIIGFDEEIISTDLNSLITVTGSKSGVHQGKIFLAEDGKKLIFTPYTPYVLNETVEVNIDGLRTSRASDNKLRYTFQTQTKKINPDYAKIMSNEIGSEEYNKIKFSGDYAVLPNLSVTVSNNPSPGNIFLNNYPTQGYPTHVRIVKNDGSTVYSREIAQPTTDFNRQPNGLYVYFKVSGPNFTDPGIYYAEDAGFNLVDSFYCGNGYTTDGHDLRLLNNGHALVMSYDPQPVDMSVIVPGGNPNAIVYGLIIQEIDQNKNVVFQWRSWDYIPITDAPFENLTAATIDYIHGNAIELDNDGNLMISSRHINEITKINRSTGDIIWRFGGVGNDFTFTNDTIPFHYQHDIRRIANGNVTLYDNGNFRTPSYSRALEYTLDEVNMTATKVWEYRNSPDVFGPFMGSVQRLKNGNTLIGWGGSNTTLTEVTPSGSIALEMKYPAGVWSYRAFRDEADLTLNLRIAIEGFYNTSTNQLNMNDTVISYIRSSASPYGIIDSARSIVDSVNFNGNFRFYNVPTGVYYVSTKHRNGLETWSKSGGESFTLNGVYQYDLTSAASQAYGSNLTLKGSKYCIYSGDVNQDGNINLSDIIDISNDLISFVTGYVVTDINGDKITDTIDQLIAYNNAINLVAVIKP
jgi:hypothetical protein